MTRVIVLASALLSAAIPPSHAVADTIATFYRGKTIELIIGYTVGGAYDVYARLLAQHLGRHIPGNPNVVAKNMEGAGSMRATNWIYAAAPKDGTVIATASSGIGTDTLLQTPGARFEADKFTWVGSANHEAAVCASWHTSGVTTYDDLLKRELIIAASGMNDASGQFPKVFNAVLGTRFKIVTGYPGGNEMTLAVERGEVQGRCGWSWGGSIKATRAAWIADKKINVLLQVALDKHPDLRDVPLAIDLARNEEQRHILRLLSARQVMGRPFFAPPGVPAERAAALQKGFSDAMASPSLLAEAERMRLEINPVSGPALARLVNDLHSTPPDVVRKAVELLK